MKLQHALIKDINLQKMSLFTQYNQLKFDLSIDTLVEVLNKNLQRFLEKDNSKDQDISSINPQNRKLWTNKKDYQSIQIELKFIEYYYL